MRAAKEQEKTARLETAKESPSHKVAVDLLHYLERILDSRDLSHFNGLEKAIRQWRSDLMMNLGLSDRHPDMTDDYEF